MSVRPSPRRTNVEFVRRGLGRASLRRVVPLMLHIGARRKTPRRQKHQLLTGARRERDDSFTAHPRLHKLCVTQPKLGLRLQSNAPPFQPARRVATAAR